MSFKLHVHLILVKIDVVYPTFHISVKHRKITFNS